MMKKLIALFLAAALVCTACCAPAEEAPVRVTGDIRDDGSYTLTVVPDENDTGKWIADPMTQDQSVVKLAESGMANGVFTARYVPAGDGEVSVSLWHYDKHGACDELRTFDLKVQDGKVLEVTGGSLLVSPSEEEVDPYLSGEWLEKDTQFNHLTVKKNPEGGWDIEILSPMTHDARVIRATVYHDCDYDSFVYNDGKKYDLLPGGGIPEKETETGLWGRLAFERMDDDLVLAWYSMSEGEDVKVVFVRAEGTEG